jgi:two-component system phosphate regulon sensor histidine kinase PhoR
MCCSSNGATRPPAHLGLKLERDKGMRVTNLIRNPAFMDYIILGRYEQPLTLALHERKLIVQIIPFENRARSWSPTM